MQKLIDQLNAQVSLNDDEVSAAYAERHNRIRAALIGLDAAGLADQIRRGLTEADLQLYYARHLDLAQQPATRTIDYVGMSRAEAIAAQPRPSAEEIETYYRDHADEFKKDDGGVKPLDEVRDAVQQPLLESRADKAITSLALDLQDDVERGLRLEEIAAARQRTVQRAGPGEKAPSPWS